MKTHELMSSSVISIHPDEPVSAAARQLQRNNIGALPVCDDSGRLRGIITDRDIVIRCIAADMDPGETRIREIMSRGVVSVSPDDSVEDAARKMADHQVRREPERITLNVADLLDDLIRQADELVGKPVALMTKDDKVKAIRYLSNSGALLITKSGDKIARHFGISKYTLYSYLDNSKTGGTNDL